MEKVKNFILFGGDRYYPSGGWEDYVNSYETLEEARMYAKDRYDWWHVLDLTTKTIVWQFWDQE